MDENYYIYYCIYTCDTYSVMKPILIVISYAILFVGLIYVYWHGNYHKHIKFVIFLSVLSTISGIVFGSAVVFQIINYNKQKSDEEINMYNQQSKEFLDEIVGLLIQHPEMNYFYNDINGLKPIDATTTRNYVLEHQFSTLIFSKIAKFANFSHHNLEGETHENIEIWMGHIIDTFMKSPTLQYYWTNYYKPDLSGPEIKRYMDTHFKL